MQLLLTIAFLLVINCHAQQAKPVGSGGAGSKGHQPYSPSQSLSPQHPGTKRRYEAAKARAPSPDSKLSIDPRKPNFGLPYRVTNLLAMNITLDDKPLGGVRIGLFGETVPKTAANFKALCTHDKKFGYRNSKFHRLIRGFLLQGGDFTNGDGSGGHSIYNGNGRFDDENFVIPHAERTLSMANAGKNKNGGQFFISTSNSNSILDGKHVVFGMVLAGYKDVIKRIESYAKVNSSTNQITSSVVITNFEIVENFLAYKDPLTSDHQGNDDGTEGPKKPKWKKTSETLHAEENARRRQAQSKEQQRRNAENQRAQQYGRRGSASRSIPKRDL